MDSKSYVIAKRAAGAAVAVLMLLEGIINAYAVPTIPYTFTASSTAKAAEVNANFQALANGMPKSLGGVNGAIVPYSPGGAVPGTVLTAGYTTVGSLGVTGNGSPAIILVSGIFYANHLTGTQDNATIAITIDGAMTTAISQYTVAAAMPTGIYSVPLFVMYYANPLTTGFHTAGVQGMATGTVNCSPVSINAIGF